MKSIGLLSCRPSFPQTSPPATTTNLGQGVIGEGKELNVNDLSKIQAAKDLIWENIEEHNRKLFMHIAEKKIFPPTDKLIIGFTSLNS